MKTDIATELMESIPVSPSNITITPLTLRDDTIFFMLPGREGFLWANQCIG